MTPSSVKPGVLIFAQIFALPEDSISTIKAPYAEGARKIRIIPDCAHDKHTTSGQRMGRGVEYFFNDGVVLVNCTLLDPYRDRARAICIAREKQELRERWLKADERRDKWR